MLRKCQTEAINSFYNYFYEEENDKGIISMCCGSGKTKTMYEIIKKCISEGELYFIIVTSRVLLVEQTIQEFKRWILQDNSNIDIQQLGGGEMITLPLLSCRVRDSVSNKKPIIIITTYDSANKIKDAGIKLNGKDLMCDLLIFDEAHNTTGDQKKKHRVLLDKKAINDVKFTSSKTLFMTATPTQILLKDKNTGFQNEETVYSMDKELKYGKILYEYSFADGVKDGILVPFETVYYTVKDNIHSRDIQNSLKSKSKEEMSKIYFKTISNFLIDNIQNIKLRHVLIYLSCIDKINIMNEILKQVIAEKGLSYETYIINSKMSDKSRDNELKNFEKPSINPKILFTVSIFDEGIDVKCIDSVFFAEERETESRITQNIGRCLRVFDDEMIAKYGYNKRKAYVIIPNIVYEYTNSTSINNDNSVKYSSYFKNIRHIIQILSNNTDSSYFKKYVKSDKNVGDTEKEKGLAEMCDNIIVTSDNVNHSNELTNVTNKDVINLSDHYLVNISSNNNINNVTLDDIRKYIREKGITTIETYIKSVKKNKFPYGELHKDFEKDFICWGEIFDSKVYTYKEAQKFIKDKINEIYRTSSINFIKLYNDILNDAIHGSSCVSNTLSRELEKIIYIPNRPKEYYKKEWIDWSDFLSYNLDPITLMIGKGTAGDENIKNLVNNDKKKIDTLIYGKSNHVQIDVDFTLLKSYFKNKYNSDFTFKLYSVIKNNGFYDYCYILGDVKEINYEDDIAEKNTPLIIYPEDLNYIYYGLNRNNKTSCEAIHFSDNDINELLCQVVNKCKIKIKLLRMKH